MNDYDDVAVAYLASLMSDGYADEEIEVIIERMRERMEDPTEFIIIEEDTLH